MAETIVNGVWSWYQLPMDLEEQGGYEGVSINPLSVGPAHCSGETDGGNKFSISWISNYLMMISLLKDEPVLIEAFATVVEYKPFAKYKSKQSGLITYEWAKKDSRKRFAELREGNETEELQSLVPEDELTGSE